MPSSRTTAPGLLLRDLGSQNGVIHRGQRQLQVALHGDSVVRLGHTRLRVRPTIRWRRN
jgi:pSer/pThr/pTyr-binding forkhead associated (FHA) protein